MDELNDRWLDGKRNFYFRYKYKIVESKIVGTCLNIGCGHHKIKGAKNVDFPEVDACSLPYKDNSYDTVLLLDVIEHLFNDGKAIMEATRVARKKVIITVPAMQSLWSSYDILLGHRMRYSKNFFYGWENLKMRYMFGALYPLYYLRKFTSGKTPNLPNWLDNILYGFSHIRLPFGSTLLVEINK